MTCELPQIVAGPLLRHTSKDLVTVWLVASAKSSFSLSVYGNDEKSLAGSSHLDEWQVGERCYIYLVRFSLDEHLQDGQTYSYDVEVKTIGESDENGNGNLQLLSKLLPRQLYKGNQRFEFTYKSNLSNVMHGSCRKAHHTATDALPALDDLLDPNAQSQDKPDLLLFTGDQVYIDDVAGPMLSAIQQVIQHLGLYHEDIEGSSITNSCELAEHEKNFYLREDLLPQVEANEELEKAFFKGKKKPIFTSVHSKNHLISLNEMLALYFLSWSSRLWCLVDLSKPKSIPDQYSDLYETEKEQIHRFAEGLERVERALAHIPTYMMFDDHDVTDDWNLTRGWEEQVYGNPFSKQIIGNALIAYLLCQGSGNPYDKIEPIIHSSKSSLQGNGLEHQDKLIDELLDFDQWHYQLATHPPVQVLDTRTRRWRSESNKNKPSGLMDWEALCELQQKIIGNDSVIMVSPAPVYGIKFIEVIQRIFTFFGGALIVDAENWMAHRGTANVMLNIFRHMKTPPNFIILSGDVHYSFVYDVSLRFRRNSPEIIQFTCSGIHNEFPDKLIRWFERLNRFFYGSKSPLNFLTKRRNMSVKHRKGENFEGNIVNKCALGLLKLDDDGTEKQCKLICADGSKVNFE